MIKSAILSCAKYCKDFNRHSLAFQLLIHILLISSLITLIITALQLYSDYKEEVQLIDERMVQINRSYRDSLANAMWYLQLEQVEKIIGGINSFDEVHFVEIIIEGDEKYSNGERREKNVKQYDTDMMLYMDGKELYVGRLSIHSNIDGVIQRLSNKFYIILVSQAVKTFVVSVFILFVVYYLITRHLKTITGFTKEIEIGDLNNTLDLGRLKKGQNPDELDQIVNAINQMIENLKKGSRDRSRVENDLIASAARFDRWKASNFVGIIQSNDKGDIVDANDALLGMLGYSRTELLDGKLDWKKLTPEEYLYLDENAIEESSRMGYWNSFEK